VNLTPPASSTTDKKKTNQGEPVIRAKASIPVCPAPLIPIVKPAGGTISQDFLMSKYNNYKHE